MCWVWVHMCLWYVYGIMEYACMGDCVVFYYCVNAQIYITCVWTCGEGVSSTLICVVCEWNKCMSVMCVNTYKYMLVCMWMYLWMGGWVSVCVHVCGKYICNYMHGYVYKYVFMYMCQCVHDGWMCGWVWVCVHSICFIMWGCVSAHYVCEFVCMYVICVYEYECVWCILLELFLLLCSCFCGI